MGRRRGPRREGDHLGRTCEGALMRRCDWILPKTSPFLSLFCDWANGRVMWAPPALSWGRVEDGGPRLVGLLGWLGLHHVGARSFARLCPALPVVSYLHIKRVRSINFYRSSSSSSSSSMLYYIEEKIASLCIIPCMPCTVAVASISSANR